MNLKNKISRIIALVVVAGINISATSAGAANGGSAASSVGANYPALIANQGSEGQEGEPEGGPAGAMPSRH